MAILVGRETRVIVQGLTGRAATFHVGRMLDYGTRIVGGVTPGKGGSRHLDLPVFDTVAEAVRETGANASLVFVPPASAGEAMIEAIRRRRTARRMCHRARAAARHGAGAPGAGRHAHAPGRTQLAGRAGARKSRSSA